MERKDRGQDWKDAMLEERNTSTGNVKVELYKRYYDVANTIARSGPVNPNSPDDPVYNDERIHDALQRNAPKLQVINDQPVTQGATLFVVVSHGGEQTFSPETPIYPQETKIYYNVYTVRLRSELVGHRYRVTEYNIHVP